MLLPFVALLIQNAVVHDEGLGALWKPDAHSGPGAEIHVLGTGHFALDTAADQISELIRNFLPGKRRDAR